MGNTMLRERTAHYVAARARELRTLLSREEGPLAAHVDLGHLKMRERDAVEAALATYLHNVEFDAERLRDERLRAFYGERYDVRRNVLDWDYSMGLVETAPIVHRVHFREWRMSGMAYEVRDAAYDSPNRTLASAAAGRQKGASVLKRGFWGDVVNTPYGALGAECADGRFFAKRGDQMVKTACDVAYYNVVGWFTKLETGRPFELRADDFDDFAYGASVGSAGLVKGFLRADQPGPRPREQSAAVLEDVTEGDEAGADKLALDAASEARARRELAARRRAALPCFSLALRSGRPLDLLQRSRIDGRCAHVHLASHAAHMLAAPLTALLAERGVVCVESARFLCEVHRDAKRRLAIKVLELGERAGLAPAKPLEQVDGQHDSLVRFVFERAQEEARRAAALARYGPSVGAPPAADAGAPAADDTGAPAAELAESMADALSIGARAGDGLEGAPAAEAISPAQLVSPAAPASQPAQSAAAKPPDAIGARDPPAPRSPAARSHLARCAPRATRSLALTGPASRDCARLAQDLPRRACAQSPGYLQSTRTRRRAATTPTRRPSKSCAEGARRHALSRQRASPPDLTRHPCARVAARRAGTHTSPHLPATEATVHSTLGPRWTADPPPPSRELPSRQPQLPQPAGLSRTRMR